MPYRTNQGSSSFDTDIVRASFGHAYDAWADRAYGFAVAVTSSPEVAAEVAAAAWCSVWERWSAYAQVHESLPDDAWLNDELRCATLVAVQPGAHLVPA
ncbi:MAG: hypothetical protein H7287_02305 [Thermoleophilia bacterium]|nr:hypothetical protein [Thermoleophilia bacterium]